MIAPKIHVMLASYNPSQYFQPQLQSILSQKGVEVKVTIFDDGSPDQRVLQSCPEVSDPRVSIVQCSATGSAGKNFLRAITILDDAEADWFAFSDQDDIWNEKKLLEGVRHANLNGAAGYSSDLDVYNGERVTSKLKKVVRQRTYDHFFQGASAGCTYVLRKDLVAVLKDSFSALDITPLPRLTSHDWLVYFVARQHGFVWVHDSRSFIWYRQHQDNVYGATVGIRGFLTKVKSLKGGIAAANTATIINLCSISKRGECFVLSASSIFGRLLHISSVFQFRREAFYSIGFFALWVFGGFYPFRKKNSFSKSK